MTSVFFLVFYNFLYYLGFGLFNVYLKYKKKDLSKEYFISGSVKINTFFPLFALFFIGNSVFILNFFYSIKSVSIFLGFIYLFLCFIGIYLQYIYKNNIQNLLPDVIFPIIFGISSYGSRLHYDAGAYHLNNQNWIFNEKIVFGLSNLNIFYSYGSLQEYLSVIFWPFENFIYLHFINITFFVVLFKFLYNNLINDNLNFLKLSSLFLVGYSFLDNFGINGGGNGFFQIQTIGKPDVSVGILFLISFMIFANSFIKNSYLYRDFLFVLFLSFFSFQLKLIGGALIFLLIPLFYKTIISKKLKIINYIFDMSLFIVLFFLWLLKTYIISGCLIFPIQATCFKNTKWIDLDKIIYSTQKTIKGNFAYSFDQNFTIWLNEWLSNGYSFQVFSNLLISLLALYLAKLVIFKTKTKFTRLRLVLLLFLLVNIFIFFLTVPVDRNGYGIWASLVCLIVLNSQSFRFKYSEILLNKVLITAAVIFVVLLSPRMYMYEEFIENYSSNYNLEPKEVEYIKNSDGISLLPKEGNQCWISSYCLLYSTNINEVKNGSYRMFLPEGR